MNKILTSSVNLILVLVFVAIGSKKTFGEESESILDQLEASSYSSKSEAN